MSDKERNQTDVLGQLGDELKLQAWLAAADFRNPSLHEGGAREEIDALATARDELRLQMHLGRMEAQDEWHHAEDAWRKLKHQVSEGAEDVADNVRALLGRIRGSYDRLTEDAPTDEAEG